MEIAKANSAKIKKINCSNIFRYLYDHEGVSRKNIADSLQLSIPTVTQNLRELEANGLIEEAGLFASTGGRKATALQVNYNARYAIGVDITSSHVTIVVLNLKGTVLFQERLNWKFRQTTTFRKKLSDKIEATIDALSLERERILGVGISVPAIIAKDNVSVTTTMILGPDLNIRNFTEMIPYRCHLIHDSTAACVAELLHHDEKENFVYVFISNSVGGAFVQDGSLCEGDNRRSAEFGHMTLVPDGRVCYCGKAGCADPYCNTRTLDQHTGGSLYKFFQRLEQKDPEIVPIWEEYLHYLAIMLNNVYTAFDTDLVIGGYLGCFISPYIPQLQSMISQRNTFEPTGSFLRECSYQKFEAAAVGAAYSFIRPFLQEI